MDNFKLANSHVRTLLPRLPMTLPYQIVPAADIQRALGTPRRWLQFYSTFPESRGFSGVSAVGFYEARTRAMVYAEYHCGPLCGGGYHHLLEKRNGERVAARPAAVACVWKS
jgi:hypothetical protein